MGKTPHAKWGYQVKVLGKDSAVNPRFRLGRGLIRRSKDWSCTEFTFLSISHKLGTEIKKGECNERTSNCCHPTDQSHYSIRYLARVWRMDTSS